MTKTKTEVVRVLADEHWAWLSTLLEKIYKDAFIHGYKHGSSKRLNKEVK